MTEKAPSIVSPATRTSDHPLLGKEVGAGRWPNPLHEGRHPWKGVVLSHYDRRAWAGSLAFPVAAEEIDQQALDRHVDAWIARSSVTLESVPVLWDFAGEKRVYFDAWDNVVEYRADLANWHKAYAECVEEMTRPTWLQQTRRDAAQRAFESFDFGQGVDVSDASGWEYNSQAKEFVRPVYVHTCETIEDNKDSTRLMFIVQFKDEAIEASDVYARDDVGSEWGSASAPSVPPHSERQRA